MMPGKLAIAIPTYNRSPALSVNLPLLLEEARELDVEVYLSDDSSDDYTEVLANDLLRANANFHYRRNRPPLRHDGNIFSTLNWPNSEYVWLLGDVFRPQSGELKAVVEFLHEQDFVFINVMSDDDRVLNSICGDVGRRFLLSKLWHQTLTAATIFHRSVISWAKECVKETHANFPQLDIILGYSEQNDVTLGWYGRKVLHSEKKDSSYWISRAIDVFVDDWVSVVTAYPNVVTPDQLTGVLRSHSSSTRLFDVRFLRELAKVGNFDRSAINRPYFWDVMHESRRSIMLVLLRERLRRLLRIKRS